MLRCFLATLLLAFPLASHAGEAHRAKFAVLGDQQDVMSCAGASTAWTWGLAAATWVAANDFAAAVQVGDITNSTGAGAYDCECLATADPGVCTDIDHSIEGTGYCTNCDNADATTCTGGTAGLLCEWTRAQALVAATGVPTLVTAGNRDHGYSYWDRFNDYFGAGNPPAGAISTGFHVATGDSGSDAGQPLGSDSYMVVSAAGQRWLFIQIHYYVDDESVAWAQGVIDQYPGMPTAIVSHMMHTVGDAPTGWTYASLGGNGPKILTSFGDIPQVFLYISGHNHEMMYLEDTTNTYKNIGVMIDYSSDDTVTDHTLYDGASSRQMIDYGGGGVVGVMTADIVAGQLSWYVYSPQLDTTVSAHNGMDEHYTDASNVSFWSTTVDFCGSSRFTMDDGACDDYSTPQSTSGSQAASSGSGNGAF